MGGEAGGELRLRGTCDQFSVGRPLASFGARGEPGAYVESVNRGEYVLESREAALSRGGSLLMTRALAGRSLEPGR